MNFNDLKHGNPSCEDKSKIDNQLVVTVLGKWFMSHSSPNPNGSEKTQKELNRLLQKSTCFTDKETVEAKDIKEQSEYVDIDKDLLVLYKRLIKSKKLKINEGELKSIVKKLEPFIISLKYHYNRPRPNVIAPYYDLPIYPTSSKSLLTPSYPSRHALMSLIISAHITTKYPKYKTEIIEINKKILESREALGLSYYSDISSSVQIFKTIDSTIGIEDFLNQLK